MTKLGKILILGIVIIAFSALQFYVQPNTAFACTCVADISQEESFAQAKAVFVGRVLSIEKHNSIVRQLLRTLPWFENNPTYRTITFHVTKRWKGVDANLVTVATGFGGGDCGFLFAEGERYLVYANDGDFYGEELATNICMRTEVERYAEGDIAALGTGDSTFTDEELIYNPTRDSLWNKMIGEIFEFFTEPITRTIFVAPWHIAFLILTIYIALPILLMYFLIKRFIKK